MNIDNDLSRYFLHDALIEHIEIKQSSLIFGIESFEERPDYQSEYGYLIFRDVDILRWEPKILFTWSDPYDGQISVMESRSKNTESNTGKSVVFCLFFLATPESYKSGVKHETSVVVIEFMSTYFEWVKIKRYYF